MASDVPDLADHPTPLLVDILARALADAIDESLHRSRFHDLTRAHGTVFETLDPGGSRVVDMAERARMTKQGMGQLVSALERLGYVQRRPDPSDDRAKLVTLTGRGRRAADAGIRGLTGVDEAWRTHLGDERYGELRGALEALCLAFGRSHIR